MVSGVTQGSILEPLLFMLYTSKIFLIVGNVNVGSADDSNLSSYSKNAFASSSDKIALSEFGSNCQCLKRHMRLSLLFALSLRR